MSKRNSTDSSGTPAKKEYKRFTREDLTYEVRKGLLMSQGGVYLQLCRECTSRNWNLGVIFSEGYYRSEIQFCPTCALGASKSSYGRYLIKEKDKADTEAEQARAATSEPVTE